VGGALEGVEESLTGSLGFDTYRDRGGESRLEGKGLSVPGRRSRQGLARRTRKSLSQGRSYWGQEGGVTQADPGDEKKNHSSKMGGRKKRSKRGKKKKSTGDRN